MLSIEIAGSYGICIASFWRNFHTALHSGYTTLHPINSAGGFPFSASTPAFIVCRFFDDGHCHLCKVIPHCSFDLRFSDNEHCWTSFHVFIGHLYVFGEMSVYVFCPFFDWVIFLILSCLYNLEINPLSVVSLEIIFSHSEGFLLILFIVSFAIQKLLSLIRSHLFLVLFSITQGSGSKRILLWYMSKGVLSMISSRSFIVSGLTF